MLQKLVDLVIQKGDTHALLGRVMPSMNPTRQRKINSSLGNEKESALLKVLSAIKLQKYLYKTDTFSNFRESYKGYYNC